MVRNSRDWISVVISKETRRRLIYLIKHWGENRSQTVRRCIDQSYESTKSEFEANETAKKIFDRKD